MEIFEYHNDDELEKDKLAQLGLCVSLLANNFPDSNIDNAFINKLIAPAVRYGNIKIFTNRFNESAAFYIWLNADRRVLDKVLMGGFVYPGDNDWLEGDDVIIICSFFSSYCILSLVRSVLRLFRVSKRDFYFYYNGCLYKRNFNSSKSIPFNYGWQHINCGPQ